MQDLNTEISQQLGVQSPQLQKQWDTYTPVARSEGTQADMVRLNDFLRTQLGLLPVDTLRARETLNAMQTKRQWMKGFNECILPLITEHGLPVWNR